MPQWIVDETGLTGNGYYWIEKSRLLDQRGDLYEWPLQVCTKTWIDFADFCRVFEEALKFHRRRYSKKRLAATYAQAERRIAESAEYDAIAREMFPEKFEGKVQLWSLDQTDKVWNEQLRRRALHPAANSITPAKKAA